MSEPAPEGFGLGPEELRRMDEVLGEIGNLPDFMGAAIEAIASAHAQWYRAWQAAGVPEPRAAEWVTVMIAAMARSGQLSW